MEWLEVLIFVPGESLTKKEPHWKAECDWHTPKTKETFAAVTGDVTTSAANILNETVTNVEPDDMH